MSDDDQSESGLGSTIGAKANRLQARHPDQKLGGSKLDSCFLEVYPKNNVRRPKLLEQLQDMLAHSMCAAEMAVDANLVPGQRNPDAAACLTLDVYRQVFDAFIDGFAAYRPLLTQVKDSYDAALKQGLQCALENMDLRAELAAAADVQANAVSLARSHSAAEAATSKLHLQTKLVDMEMKATETEERASKLAALSAKTRASAEAAQAEVAELRKLEEQLQQALRSEADWRSKPSASYIGAALVRDIAGQPE
ncbi:hypothetical protein ABBQ38_004266 [Trebouxia sp. C0009 RCD-2024]